MFELSLALAGASFIAGVLMFIAPCTLPLVPAYLAFISGVQGATATSQSDRRKIVINGLGFVVGFTVVFTLFGMLAGFFGGFIGSFREILTQLGGAAIILFGLIMFNIIKIASLQADHKIPVHSFVVPGQPMSAALIGSIFALGWTPCVGPVLASVLLLATTASTAISGGALLFIFSLGLAIPFLVTAVLYASASRTIARFAGVSKYVNIIGGIFLLCIGALLLTDNFGLTVEYGYRLFSALGLEGLFDYY